MEYLLTLGVVCGLLVLVLFLRMSLKHLQNDEQGSHIFIGLFGILIYGLCVYQYSYLKYNDDIEKGMYKIEVVGERVVGEDTIRIYNIEDLKR